MKTKVTVSRANWKRIEAAHAALSKVLSVPPIGTNPPIEIGGPGRPQPVPLPPRTDVEISSGSAVNEHASGTSDTLIVENKNFLYTGDRTLEGPDACCGVFALGPYSEIIIRNCSFKGFVQGVVAQGDAVGTIGQLNVVDSEIIDVLGQGAYTYKIDRTVIRRNHLVDCGSATILDHGIYIQGENGPDVFVENNTLINAGSHGAQLRSGGTFRNNFVARCGIGASIGGGGPQSYPGGVFGSVTDNVVCEGKDINAVDVRGMGFVVGNVNGCIMNDNLLYQNAGGGPVSLWLNGDGMGTPGVGAKNVTGVGNQVLNWKWGIRKDGVTTGYTSTAWGPEAAMPDTAPVLVLDTLLGPNWIQMLLTRQWTVQTVINAVRNQVP